MRAVVYDKPFSVSVREVEKPTILHPDDIIVKGQRLFILARKSLLTLGKISYDIVHLRKVTRTIPF
jgi:hypothetical protein